MGRKMMAFPELPGLYDLAAFMQTLPSSSDFKKIRGSIEKIGAAGSAHADLELASLHLSAGVELELRKREVQEDAAVLNSIAANYNYALILYSRATQTKSKHRKSFNVQDRFAEVERRQHDLLFKLRNDGVAHFGPGPHESNLWSADSVVLKVLPGGVLKVATPYMRKGHMLIVNDALEMLIPRAIEIVEAIRVEGVDTFFNEYKRLIHVRPQMRRDLDKSVWRESVLGTDGMFADLYAGSDGEKPSCHFTDIRKNNERG